MSSLSSIPQLKEVTGSTSCSEKNYQPFPADNYQLANQINADSACLQSSRFPSNYMLPSDTAPRYLENNSYSLQKNAASGYQQNIHRPSNLALPPETAYLPINPPASNYSSATNTPSYFQNLYEGNPAQQCVTVPENCSQTRNIYPSTAGPMSVIQRTTNINFNIIGTTNAPGIVHTSSIQTQKEPIVIQSNLFRINDSADVVSDFRGILQEPYVTQSANEKTEINVPFTDIQNQSYRRPNERQNLPLSHEQPLSVNEINSSSMSPTLDKDRNKVGRPSSITNPSSSSQLPISVPVVQSSSKTPDFENTNTDNINGDRQLLGKNHCVSSCLLCSIMKLIKLGRQQYRDLKSY